MRYDPQIEERWMAGLGRQNIFNLASNISLDSRLGEDGLGQEYRRSEFWKIIKEGNDGLFEEAWNDPPQTWPKIEELANRLWLIRK